jgi:NAD(P) transhydrogenase subunit alpha
MKVGIPCELDLSEHRVAATPKTVQRLIKQGFTVHIEAGAGLKASFSDQEYIDAGANIESTHEALLATAEIIFKVQPPTLTEVEGMSQGSALFSYLWPAQNQDLLEQLAAKKINAVAMDAIPRITRAQKMDVLSSMANIAGYRAVIEAAGHYGKFLNGQITAAGKIEPAKVLIIGAGVAGLAAIGAAKSLGAIVRAFDTRKDVSEQIQSMGAEFLTVEIEEDGSTSSGYSKEMSPAFIEAEMKLFREQAQDVDIIITTAQIPGRPAPKLILKDMVEMMKQGSVIIDLAAPTGGNCELTKPGQIYQHNSVTIAGKVSQMPSQASQLYANNICHFVDDMGGAQNFQFDTNDDIVSRAAVVLNGAINWPPKPLPVQHKAQPAKTQTLEPTVPKIQKPLAKADKPTKTPYLLLILLGGFFVLLGQVAPAEFLTHFTVFVLSCFVGYQLVWNVAHALHTPLMSVTNAISGIILIGGLIQVGDSITDPVTLLAFVAIFVATINVAGGFYVTHRMLKMFRK